MPELEIDVARQFVDAHLNSIRFVGDLGWFVWTGTHWQRDCTERVRELAKDKADELRAEAAKRNDDRLWKLAQRIGTSRGIGAVLDIARSDARIRIGVDDLDPHPALLACANGEIDLRTGILEPHDRRHMVTRCANAAYFPGARFEPFERLLEHLAPDEDSRRYLQRAVGYSLSASASEDAIFLLVGKPRCGKSTLLRALSESLGEHFASASMRSFCASRMHTGGNAPRSDLFRLVGRRIVAASEIHPGLEFDVGLLKSIAGGERIPVRELRQAEIAPRTSFTLWLVCNDGDLPRMRAEDDALWERVRRIPVGETLGEGQRDTSLRDAFSSEDARSAVLAWAVRGAVEWRAHGLGVAPQAVKEATSDLRGSMDPIAPFVAARIRFDSHAVTPKRSVREAYERWCEDSGDLPCGAKRLAAALRAAAAVTGGDVAETTAREGGSVVQAWRGLRLAEATDAL